MKIIKMFLTGSSYDDITVGVGVTNGSVVNVVSDFREGKLSVSPGMTEYVDELRKVAVDLKKHDALIHNYSVPNLFSPPELLLSGIEFTQIVKVQDAYYALNPNDIFVLILRISYLPSLECNKFI